MTVYTYYNHDVLIHHGIMGQKWGKRNGPPYPLGYDDHSSAEKEQNSIRVLSGQANALKAKAKKKYDDSWDNFRQNKKEEGFTDEQIEALKKRAETIAKVGAVALGVGVAYCLVSNAVMNKDFVLEAGKQIYRVSSSNDGTVNDIFYAATNKFDNKKYSGHMAAQRKAKSTQMKKMAKLGGLDQDDLEYGLDESQIKGFFRDSYNNVFALKNQTKVAGAKTCKQLYNEMRKEALKNEDIYGWTDKILFNQSLPKSYAKWNQNLGVKGRDSEFAKNFFKELKSRGYGGIVDINDSKLSGYTSTRPVIFFGQQNNVDLKSSSKITSRTMMRDLAETYPIMQAQAYLNNPAKMALAVGAGGFYSYSKLGDKFEEENLEKSSKKTNGGAK